MPDDRPTLPDEIPNALVARLDEQDADTLRAIAEHASDLAEHRECDQRLDDQGDGDHDDRPDDVPARASITTKTINENRYEYWQWREGDSIKSQYIGPAERNQ
jgi:hypothetical protein